MSSRQVRAGGAFVEVTIRDKMAAGLVRAQAKLAMFARSVKTMTTALAGGLRAVGHAMTFVGTSIAAVGAGILAALGASIKTFLDVSEHAKKMRKSIDGINPAKAERLSKAIRTLEAVWGAIKFRAGEALAEPLTNILLVLIKLGAQAANFIKNNQQLIVTLAAVGAILVVVGTVVAVMGGAFLLAAAAVAGVGAILTAIATPVGMVVALVAVLAAAILLAAGAFVVFSEAGRDSFLGILAALASGDILAAWHIITEGMTIAWQSAIFLIEKTMNDMIVRIAHKMGGWASAMAATLAGIEATTGMNLGSASFGALARGAETGVTVGADARTNNSAAELAAAMARLAAMNDEARAKFMSGFSGVSISLPDLGNIIGQSQKFGVTGSTSSATAGMNRSMNGLAAEQKKGNDLLDRILKVLKETKVEGALEFAP